jgi:hypothetical protein
MKTFIAAKRTMSANNSQVTSIKFKTELEAEAQAQKWFEELIEQGYVITNLSLGRISKDGEDVYIYVLN